MRGGVGYESSEIGDVVGVEGVLQREVLLLGGQALAHAVVDLGHQLGVLDEERLHVLPALAELLTLVGEPGARLLDEPEIDRDVEERPSRLMPLPYMMSNSACLNGDEHLFLTTLTLVRLPTTSAPSLIASMRRMSSRMEE